MIMILITGASGNVGKTVLQAVAKSGAKHRAMYRSAAEAAKAPAGTEPAIADFAKPETLGAALKNVDSVYLVCSPIPELVQLESNMIDACVAAGVQHVVLNSALGAGDYEKSFPSWHRKVEENLKASGIEFVILRPNGFMQNILAFLAPSIRAQGAFYDAMGDAKTSLVDLRDVAAVAAMALTSEGHATKIYELKGPEALTQDEIAKRIAERSGRAVSHVNIPQEAHQKAMLDLGMPEWQVKALIELQDYYVRGSAAAVDGLIAKLLGRPERTMDAFLTENAGEFREQAA